MNIQNKEGLNDLIARVVGGEILTTNDLQCMINYLHQENDLSTKFLKIIETLNNKIIKNPIELLNHYEIIKNSYITMTNKSKNIFDFCIGTVISLINKMSCELGQEELIIKLALDIIENNKLIKSENYFQISKKFNIDEENLLKIINKKDTIENLNKIFFILETIEKKTIPNKTNLNYTINNLIKLFDNFLIDFVILNLVTKIKPTIELQKKDLEFEKLIIKLIFKKNDYNSFKYFLKYLYSVFDQNLDIKIRKQLFNSVIIVFKINGKSFFHNIVENLLKDVHNNVLNEYFMNFNFSIINESVNFKFQNIDTSYNYFKCFDMILCECFDFNSEKNLEKQMELQNFLFQILKNIIILCEIIFKIINDNKFVYNVNKYIEFYLFIQVKFFRIFSALFDEEKKKKLEILFYTKKYQKAKKKHISFYPYQMTFVENLVAIKDSSEMSMIFHNWIIFLFKNTTIVESYEALKHLLTKSYDPSQIRVLLTIKLESERYYPSLWKDLLNTFFKETQKYNLKEVFNILTNLKYILAREINNKLRNQDNLMIKNDYSSLFYYNISHRFNFVIKFLHERFNVFSNIFFSKDYLIENISVDGKNNQDEKLFIDYIKSDNSNILPFPKNGLKISSEEDNGDYKVKLEILNILYITLCSIDSQTISKDMIKFILDLIDLDLEYDNSSNIVIDKIKCLVTIIKLCSSKKNQIIKPRTSRIILLAITQHLIDRILTNSQKVLTIERSNCIKYLVKFYFDLDFKEDVNLQIIFSIKKMIYQNADDLNQHKASIIKQGKSFFEIDEKIIYNDYIFDLLFLLNEKEQMSFYSFYCNVIKFTADRIKINKTVSSSVVKVLRLLIKIKWVPFFFVNIIERIHTINMDSVLTFLTTIYNLLSELKSFNFNLELMSRDKNFDKYKTAFKVILLENIT